MVSDLIESGKGISKIKNTENLSRKIYMLRLSKRVDCYDSERYGST